MAERPTVTAALIVIGNEVLSGRTRDANVQFLAAGLGGVGVRLMEARVIADVEDEIVEAINALRAKFDYVFTTGGIGPTHDDITSGAVAKALGRKFRRNAEAEAILRDHYRPEDVTEARLRMADLPEGAELIDNPVSRAPGFRVENVIVMPGVPRIMQAMFDGYKHNLVGGDPVQSVSITVALAAFGDFLVYSLYDERYYEAGWMLPIFVLGLWPKMLASTMGHPLLLAMGYPRYQAIAGTLKLVLLAISIPVAYYSYGILGVVIAVALAPLVDYVVLSYGLWRHGLTTFVQDLKLTCLWLAIVIGLLWARSTLGLSSF